MRLLHYSALCPSKTQLFSVCLKFLFRLLKFPVESKILLENFFKCFCSPLVCISENKLSLFKIFAITLDVQSPALLWTVCNSYFKLMIICLAVNKTFGSCFFWGQCSSMEGSQDAFSRWICWRIVAVRT